MPMDVEATVRRVLAGEVEAYAEIVKTYQQSVWGIAAYALHDVPSTEDLVQQVFISAYQCLHSYEQGRDFGKWLRGIARNTVCREIRRRSRQMRWMKAYEESVIPTMETDRMDDRMAAMRNALALCRQALPKASQEALRLRYDLGLDGSEVAKRMGRAVSATFMMLSRIRAALSLCIQKRMATA